MAIRQFIVDNFALGDCVRSYERILELPGRAHKRQDEAQPDPSAAEMIGETRARMEIGSLPGEGD